MSPEQDERARERRYLITMGIRMGCFALAVFIYPYGWHTAVLAIGAVFLPWIAVVAANVRSTVQVDRAVAPQAEAIGGTPEPAPAVDDEIVLSESPADAAGRADAAAERADADDTGGASGPA